MTEGRPPLIVVCGPPCTGKSTLATRLHVECGLAHLSIDSILRRILPNSSFEQADRDIANRALALTVEQLLIAGQGVIVDGTFTRAPHLEDLEVLANRFNARLFLVECSVDADVAVKRFHDRGGQHPAVDLDAQRVKHLNQSYPYRYRSKGLILNTSRPIEECLAEIRRLVGLVDS